MLTHVEEIVARQRYDDLLEDAARERRAVRPPRMKFGQLMRRLLDRAREVPERLPTGRIEIGTKIN